MGIRDSRTTHPLKSDRRERALDRLLRQGKYKAWGERGDAMAGEEIATLQSRIGKPPRSWPRTTR